MHDSFASGKWITRPGTIQPAPFAVCISKFDFFQPRFVFKTNNLKKKDLYVNSMKCTMRFFLII